MSILGDWANNVVSNEPSRPVDKGALHRLALDIFSDRFGKRADPECNPEGWEASLWLAHDEIERDRYDLDAEERAGADLDALHAEQQEGSA